MRFHTPPPAAVPPAVYLPAGSRRRFLAAAVAVTGLMACLLAGCDGGSTPAAASGGRLKVAATTTMIGDLVAQIGGDRVELAVIMPPGTDPHTYKPSPGDITRLRDASLIFYNGLHLEGTMVDVFEDRQKLGGKSKAVTHGLTDAQLLSGQGGASGVHDPHVWFDVKLWAHAADIVRAELVAADLAGAADYERRAAELKSRLDALDAYARAQIASIPKARRVLITSHDAYNYFGRAYDIEVRGLQGISTESEAGIQAVNAAVDYILAKKIPAIFVESSVSPKTIERVQADCRSRGVEVKIGGELFSDAMGKPGEHPPYAVETYDGMVRYNVDTIVKALK